MLQNNLLARKKNIKILVMDVDGTLTDGKINFGSDGEVFKSFDVKDGYAIKEILPPVGILPCIITGRMSTIVEKRSRDLGITIVRQNIQKKLAELNTILDTLSLDMEQVAYIGDDVNDLDCMREAGISACPSDAVDAVINVADYVCKKPGGNGAVREFIDWLLDC